MNHNHFLEDKLDLGITGIISKNRNAYGVSYL